MEKKPLTLELEPRPLQLPVRQMPDADADFGESPSLPAVASPGPNHRAEPKPEPKAHTVEWAQPVVQRTQTQTNVRVIDFDAGPLLMLSGAAIAIAFGVFAVRFALAAGAGMGAAINAGILSGFTSVAEFVGSLAAWFFGLVALLAVTFLIGVIRAAFDTPDVTAKDVAPPTGGAARIQQIFINQNDYNNIV